MLHRSTIFHTTNLHVQKTTWYWQTSYQNIIWASFIRWYIIETCKPVATKKNPNIGIYCYFLFSDTLVFASIENPHHATVSLKITSNQQQKYQLFHKHSSSGVDSGSNLRNSYYGTTAVTPLMIHHTSSKSADVSGCCALHRSSHGPRAATIPETSTLSCMTPRVNLPPFPPPPPSKPAEAL